MGPALAAARVHLGAARDGAELTPSVHVAHLPSGARHGAAALRRTPAPTTMRAAKATTERELAAPLPVHGIHKGAPLPAPVPGARPALERDPRARRLAMAAELLLRLPLRRGLPTTGLTAGTGTACICILRMHRRLRRRLRRWLLLVRRLLLLHCRHRRHELVHGGRARARKGSCCYAARSAVPCRGAGCARCQSVGHFKPRPSEDVDVIKTDRK